MGSRQNFLSALVRSAGTTVNGAGADGAGELERLMFGTGYFGAASQKVGTETSAPRTASSSATRTPGGSANSGGISPKVQRSGTR